jgi:hypothetical protein
MRAVLGHLHTMLALALQFRAAMGRWLRLRWRAQRARHAAQRHAASVAASRAAGGGDSDGIGGEVAVGSHSSSSSSSSSEDEGAGGASSDSELPAGGGGTAAKVGGADFARMEEKLLDIHRQFGQRRRWVVIMVSKFVEVADASSRAAPWLSELLDGINFNGFVKKA